MDVQVDSAARVDLGESLRRLIQSVSPQRVSPVARSPFTCRGSALVQFVWLRKVWHVQQGEDAPVGAESDGIFLYLNARRSGVKPFTQELGFAS